MTKNNREEGRRHLKNRKGMTLLEVLIAGTLLLILLVGSLSLLLAVTLGNKAAARLSQAIVLASEKIEHFKNQPFTSVSPTISCPSTPPVTAEEPDPGFRRWWCVTDLTFPGTAAIKAKQVSVFVQYKAFNTARTLAKDTIVAKP